MALAAEFVGCFDVSHCHARGHIREDAIREARLDVRLEYHCGNCSSAWRGASSGPKRSRPRRTQPQNDGGVQSRPSPTSPAEAARRCVAIWRRSCPSSQPRESFRAAARPAAPALLRVRVPFRQSRLAVLLGYRLRLRIFRAAAIRALQPSPEKRVRRCRRPRSAISLHPGSLHPRSRLVRVLADV